MKFLIFSDISPYAKIAKNDHGLSWYWLYSLKITKKLKYLFNNRRRTFREFPFFTFQIASFVKMIFIVSPNNTRQITTTLLWRHYRRRRIYCRWRCRALPSGIVGNKGHGQRLETHVQHTVGE